MIIEIFIHRLAQRLIQKKEGTGAGLVHYHLGDIGNTFSVPGTTRIGLGKKATAYNAEMLALAITGTQIADLAHDSLQAGSLISELRIYSDSTSALINITDPSPHLGQIFSLLFINNIKQAWLTIPSLQIFLNWSPGHVNVLGNEAADREARLPQAV